MARDTATAKARNRRIRQEAMREQLEAQGHLQHVVVILSKIGDEKVDVPVEMVQRYKIALDNHWKAIDKFLPTEKYTTMAGDEEAPVSLTMRWME